MAEPARKYDPDPALGQDPFNPAPPRPSPDPAAPEPLMTDMSRGETYVDNRQVVRGTSGNGLLIGAVIVILAAVAFYIFGPGAGETVAPPTETPATTTAPAPAEPNAAAPADQPAPAEPNATAPAAPADQPTPAPQGAAPAEPAPAPAEPAPAQPAPAPAQ
jgi:hypothetical protein